MITQQRLREVVDYHPETGEFTWRPRVAGDTDDPAKVSAWNTRYAGKPAGCRTHGYIRLSIDDEKHYAHRMAWLYVTGEMPELLDHINRDGTDNRFENLRIADKRLNNVNSDRKDNTSGYRGVRPSANGKRWVVQHLRPGHTNKYIGTYDTVEEAVAVYRAVSGQ